MKFRSFILSMLVLVGSLAFSAFASDGFQSILLECKMPPGRQVRIQLDASISIRYDYGMLQVSGRSVFVQVPLENVARWTFSKTPIEGVTGMEDAIADGPSAELSRGVFAVTGIDVPIDIFVYDLNGRTVLADRAVGEYYLPLDTLPSGVFVICVGSSTYKIKVE